MGIGVKVRVWGKYALFSRPDIALKAILADIIDESVDSLRFYYLGNKYQTKVEHMGVDHGISVDNTLIL